MPFFVKSGATVKILWTHNPTSMSRHDDPSFAHLELIARTESNRAHDFYSYRTMQTQKDRSDSTKLAQLSGRPVAPPIRKTIAPDKSYHGSMTPFVGQTWPSLRHDFGITSSELNPGASDFKIDFDFEKKTSFASLDPLDKHFAKLGLNIDKFQDAFLDMIDTEKQLDDTKANPHPKDGFGRKLKIDFEGNKLAYRNELRYAYQYNFNKMADESGAFIHIRFENQNQYTQDRSAFNQNLVFTFPTSNEERDIWRHVFWGEEYPVSGFPVETDVSREVSRIENSRNSRPRSVSQLASEFTKIQIQGNLPPPSYEFQNSSQPA